jgi:hypothetical protein
MIDVPDWDSYYEVEPKFLPAEVIMREVESGHIRRVSYDTYKHSMFLEFHNGSRYLYAGVPLSVFNSFLTAKSKGKYFHRYIENSYPHLKLPQQ